MWEYFLRYEAWKAAYGAYDVMDAAAAIFAVIRDVGYPGPRIDGVYVDEVQDFTQAELRLFLACCADPNAVFLTGDTCQTIARGVGFRFDDITTMFFHLREAQAARKTLAKHTKAADALVAALFRAGVLLPPRDARDDERDERRREGPRDARAHAAAAPRRRRGDALEHAAPAPAARVRRAPARGRVRVAADGRGRPAGPHGHVHAARHAAHGAPRAEGKL